VVDRPLAEARRDFEPPDVLKLIEQAMREEMGADFASMNPGGVRDRLPKGVVRERAIWNIMPFDNVMMTARVKGSDVPLQLSHGATLDPQKEYILALHDFSVTNEALRRELGIERISFTSTDRLLRQLLIDWMPDESGRSTWLGSSQGLCFEICQAMRQMLLNPTATLSRRASEEIAQLGAQGTADDGGTVLRPTRTGRDWWTYAGLKANAVLIHQ
jgi:hypothetical protein